MNAHEKYQQRLSRYLTAMRNEKPDCVPIRPFVAEFTAKVAGFTNQEVSHDYEKAFAAARTCASMFDWDAVVGNMVYVWTGLTQALTTRYYAVPGIDVPAKSGFQYLEPSEDNEFMREDEYDHLIDDPTDFLLNVWLPRTLRDVPAPGEPATSRGHQALIKGTMAMSQYFNAFGDQHARLINECGTVPAICGILKSPFDIIADKLRGYVGLTIDMAEQPEKVLAAAEALMPHMYHVALATADPQKQVPIALTTPAATAPKGMLRIPGGDFDFRVTGIGIEGENREGLDVQYPWENSPRRGHSQRMTLRPFHIDRHPVTNADYKVFLEATHYQPADAHNFLRHWVDGRPPVGAENSPVIWVSLEDARAYAAWAGKRLPHEWEWQHAAQGTDGRVYPWGNDWDASLVPEPQKGRTQLLPPSVGAHPKGASPFGVEDLVGLVWQWTDEYVDERTRAAVLRGGSCYTPQNSFWYFPQAYKLSEHGKYLLMAPAKDRSGTIGFRCVQDAP